MKKARPRRPDHHPNEADRSSNEGAGGPASPYAGFTEDDHWGTAFYGNLVHNFCEEILSGDETNQGDFAQSARVQEIINAVALSHRERRWVDLPLAEGIDGGQQSPY